MGSGVAWKRGIGIRRSQLARCRCELGQPARHMARKSRRSSDRIATAAVDRRGAECSFVATSGERLAGTAGKLGSIECSRDIDSAEISRRRVLLRLARNGQSSNDCFELIYSDGCDQQVQCIGR